MMKQNRNLLDDKPDEMDAFLQRGFRYALALTHHAAQAEDLVQDACLRLLNRNMAIEVPVLFKTIRNRFIDLYRHEKRFPTDSLSSKTNVIHLDILQTPGRDEAMMADGDMLAKSLSRLNVDEREAFFLWAVEGYTANEIAQFGSMSRNTVLSRIRRARKKLRNILHQMNTEVAP